MIRSMNYLFHRRAAALMLAVAGSLGAGGCALFQRPATNEEIASGIHPDSATPEEIAADEQKVKDAGAAVAPLVPPPFNLLVAAGVGFILAAGAIVRAIAGKKSQ